MPPPPFTPWTVYAHELVRLGYGHPLYYPEPTHLGDVEIGDVGVVQEGRFFRLFNAMREADDPANALGVPAGFVRLLVDDRLRCRLANCLPKGPVCSKSTSRLQVKAALSMGPTPTSVQGSGGYSFTVDGKQGAVAVLNDCGVQEKIMASCIAFEDYILTHNPSWAEFAQQRGLRLRPEDIVLVSGWIKTTEWALSAYVGDSRSHELSFSIAAGGYASADCAFTVEKSTGITMAERLGPRPPPPDPRPDQCMFLRYYKCRYRTSGVTRRRQPALVEEAEHVTVEHKTKRSRNVPGQGFFDFRSWFSKASKDKEPSLSPTSAPSCQLADSSSQLACSNSIVEVPSRERQSNPLDDVLRYILETTHGTNAVVCHDDVGALLTGWDDGSWAEDVTFQGYLNRVRPQVVVDVHGAHIANSSRIPNTLLEKPENRTPHPKPHPTSDFGSTDRVHLRQKAHTSVQSAMEVRRHGKQVERYISA